MNRFYRGSLALRVLAISIIFVSLPLLIYFLFVYHEGYVNRLREVVVRLRDLGYDRALVLRQLNEFDLRVVDIVDEMMATHPEVFLEQGDEWLTHILTSVAKGGGFAAAFFIPVDEGQPLICTAASNPELIGRDFSGDQYIQEVLREGQVSFISLGALVALKDRSFDKYFFFAKLVFDRNTLEPMGILNLTTPVDALIQRLVYPGQTDYAINLSLVTNDNVIIASSDPLLALRVLPSKGREVVATNQSSGLEPLTDIVIRPIGDIPGVMELVWRGERSIAVEVPVEEMDLTLLLTANQEEAFGALRDRLLYVLAIFVLIFLVGGAIALWMTHRMSQPLNELVEAMNRVSRGDLTARVKPHRMGFEINVIGEIFNKTIDSLREQMARTEAERVQKETLDQEFKIGREIQMAILPATRPKFPGVEIAARYLPAKQVGGDFYDVFVKPREDCDTQDLVLTVADASGKGISACLYSLLLRSMLRSYCMAHDDIAVIMRKANNLFLQDTGMTGMFVTALTTIYHPDNQEITYFSCGHPPGFVRRAGGNIDVLANRGLAMGVIPFEEIEGDTMTLHSGDLLVLYSDGVTEAHNEHNELFGETRLVEYIRDFGDQASVEQIIEGLLKEITNFRGAAPQFDDITVMMMRLA